MIALGFGIMWLGYLQGCYGFTLLKGYDIRWRDLANPIHPYQWPAAGQSIPKVPKGQILPGTAASTSTASTGKGKGIPAAGMA